jgi:hypothetical protein
VTGEEIVVKSGREVQEQSRSGMNPRERPIRQERGFTAVRRSIQGEGGINGFVGEIIFGVAFLVELCRPPRVRTGEMVFLRAPIMLVQ